MKPSNIYMPSMYAPPHTFRGPEKTVTNLVQGLLEKEEIRHIVVDCAKTKFPPTHHQPQQNLDVYGDNNAVGSAAPNSFPTSTVFKKWEERMHGFRFEKNQRELYGYNFDINHTITMYPRLLQAAIQSQTKSGAPIIVSPLGSDVPGHNPDYDYGDIDYWRTMANRVQYFAPNSTLLAQELEAMGIEDVKNKTVVIPSAIDADTFTPLGRNEERKAVIEAVYYGRIITVKRVHKLFEGVRDSIKRGVDVNLEILGYGSESKHIQQLIDDSNLRSRITCSGIAYDANQLPELVRNKDLYITASSNEGTPHSTLEAMALGLAVMTTKEGGGYDFYEGYNDPLSISLDNTEVDIADNLEIIQMYPDLLKSEGEKNSMIARTRFTWSRVIESYRDLYREALKSKH